MASKIIITALVWLSCAAVYVAACWFIWVEYPKMSMMKTYDIKKVNGVVYMQGCKSELTVDEIIEAINTKSHKTGLAVWNNTKKRWE